MSVETHRVLIGACGWKHPAWLDDFYSDDLPEDWQLGFYSNEFPVVYVPMAGWINEEDISEWTEDVSDSFRFILEISADVLNDESRFIAALEKVKLLEDSCLGLVFQLNTTICDDISQFQKNITLGQSIVPVCIDRCGISLNDEINNILSKQNVSEVWDGESDNNDALKRGSLSVSRVSCKGLDMKGLRKVIEGCLAASSDDCTSVLCLDGDPPSLELIRNADILLNLL